MANGFLTTHVLDTAHGTPAKGMRILFEHDDGKLIRECVTNNDGRIDEPILARESFAKGTYRLRFHVGDYFRNLGVELPDPAFLDIVTIDFGMAEDDHYHVPLLVSPFSYSTYRGS